MSLSTLLIAASLVLSTYGYSCPNGTETINAPADKSKPTFFPDFWNGVEPVPYMDAQESCFIRVNVPPGYYANVTIYKNSETPGGYVYYPNRKAIVLQNNDHHPFIFTNPYFNVVEGTGNRTGPGSSDFAFKIIWTKFPEVKKTIISINKGNPPVAVVPNGDLTTFSGASSSMMSLIAFTLADPMLNHLLRQTLIFGGDSFDSDFIGTLDQVVHSKEILTTYGNKISVYTFALDSQVNYPMFMGQDSQDARAFNSYEGINIPSTGNQPVFLDGMFGNALIVTDYNGPEIITAFQTFPSSGVIKVYEDRISTTTCIATLTSDNYKQQLPLEVKGTMKFYSMTGTGFFEMYLTRDVSRAGRTLF